ncbi:hypothetical protein FJ250_12645 [bacterium]|nr:hypothetical protein [bacterium]
MKNLTVNAMETLQRAQAKAYELSHAQLEPLHLLWALLSETGLATNVLRSLELDPQLIAHTAEKDLQSLPRVQVKDVPATSRELQMVLLERDDRYPRTAAGRRRGQGPRRQRAQDVRRDAGEDRPRARADGRRSGLPGR